MSDDLPITFVVAGQRRDTTRGTQSDPLLDGQLKASVQLAASRGATTERVTAVPGEDLVVLRLANGPALYLHPTHARDLLLSQAAPSDASRARSGVSARSETASETEVAVQAQLGWPVTGPDAAARGASRGLGDLLLSAFDVVTGLFKDKAADFVTSKVVQNVDGQVIEGVYALDRNVLTPLKNSGRLRESIPAATDPSLVLIHGTFSDTAGTFGKLWSMHRDRVGKLFDSYHDRVYGLDHVTLAQSPIHNALQLAKACPAGTRLHLLTHSRGGLVAEVLARACSALPLAAAVFAGDAYEAQRRALQELSELVRSKNIQVERVMRVACPARGTLLASKRLDAYISILKWALELANIPVAPELVKLVGQVALQRTDPAVLPGLAAMMPESPLVQWLHASEDAIPGDLRVLSGDVRPTSLSSWLKVLVSDSFYWTDNDLVVQTRSMYGGMPRASNGARFALDADGDVSHFSYFKNERSVGLIVDGLLQDAPQAFRQIGPLSWAGEDASGSRAAFVPPKPAPELPAVFVLPGILGSNLKVGDKRIWLSLRIVGGLPRLAYQQGDSVAPDGPMESTYNELMKYLADTHEVIPFGYDWRRPLEQEARRLAREVEAALDARKLSKQPVRIVAHSMGGLLARTLWLEQPQTWERLLSQPGARVLMLGTPNAGSWSPMQVLSGDDGFGSLLSCIGAPFHEYEARQLMAAMPGFLQLQAGLADPALGLDQEQTWRKLESRDLEFFLAQARWHTSLLQRHAQRWGIPPQDVLDRATALRKALDAQRERLGPFADKLLLVVGKADKTPAGFTQDANGFEYVDEREVGDGRVTLESARLPGVQTWTLDCVHGDLPKIRTAFPSFLELLERGDTKRLHPLAPLVSRAGVQLRAASTRSRPARTRLQQPPLPAEEPNDVFAPSVGAAHDFDELGVPALRVTVQNGDFTLIREPLLLGHYRSYTLTGAEDVANRLIGGTMQRSLRAGVYPDLPGSHQIFKNLTTNASNPFAAPCPAAVIVVGLGEENTLSGVDLARSVRNGVIAWSQRLREDQRDPPSENFTLSATLIGSGGTGISAGMSARQVAQGVYDANRQLLAQKWPIVGNLVLTELFLDRASAAWQELQLLAGSNPNQFQIDPQIKVGNGPLPRPIDAAYRGVDNDLIIVDLVSTGASATIEYTLDTRRARSEVKGQSTQTKLLKTLVRNASNDVQDAKVGRTLFQLLIPSELEPFLSSRSRMVLELTSGTAGIPWELLDVRNDPRSGDEPWAIRTHLLRKLRIEDYRHTVSDARQDDHVLIIGEPKCPPEYPRLPSASQEAQQVLTELRESGPVLELGDKLHVLLDADARTIIDALFERRYRVVHIAGHGSPGAQAGVVLSDGIFLGPSEIKAMRTVPELVFVNCCYLAQSDERALLAYDRAEFAASVAEELIKIGVRCVVAAGWPVDDAVAKLFALTFYRELLANRPFIEAVNEARQAAWNNGKSGNTWAAYQCYGDPEWTFYRHSDAGEAPQAPTRNVQDELSRIASASALLLALETLEVQTSFQRRNPEVQLERLRYLEDKFGELWGDAGDVAESFALAYAALGDVGIANAIVWYERSLRDELGRASRRAEEQLYNLRSRYAESRVQQLRRSGSEASVKPDIQRELAVIRDAAAALERMAQAGYTLERASLCGAAYKRIVMAAIDDNDPSAASAARDKMSYWYKRARDDAYQRDSEDAFYPALNCLAFELVSNAADPKWQGFSAEELQRIEKNIAAKIATAPEFWCKVSAIELELYRVLSPGSQGSFDALGPLLEDLQRRVYDSLKWRSVYDQIRFVLLNLERTLQPDDARLAGLEALCTQLAKYAGAEAWLSKVPGRLHPSTLSDDVKSTG